MTDTDTHLFRLADPQEPKRVIRGRVDGPRGFAEAREPLPHVIVIHGFKGFMDWGFFPETARRIAERGMIAVRFNMSGSGIGEDLQTFTEVEAFERNTYSRELEDLERVRAWIRSGAVRGIDPRRTALLGHSRGGGVALLHAAEHGDCCSVVTWASIAAIDVFDAATKAEWRRRGYWLVHNARTKQDFKVRVDALEDLEKNRERFDLVAACKRVTAPVLLVHGTADETVGIDALDRLSSALDPKRTEKLVLEGAGHTFGATHPMQSMPAAFVRAADATVAMIERHW
jgi:dienelactone hydrolase